LSGEREIEEDDQREEGHEVGSNTKTILGITPYLMSLYPLIILLYLSSPLKH
jgi:hypothetical protein